MKTPDIKQNPHPTKRYEITLTIKDAPGPFDSVTGFVQYKVSNDKCVPLTPISGATLAPEQRVHLDLKSIGDHVYRGHIYADLLQDEDYFGLGVCHWSVVGTSAILKIKAASLGPAIFSEDIVAQKAVTTYFSNDEYLNAGKAGDREHVVTGSPNRALYGPESRTDLFSITLSSKEDFQ